MFKKLSIFRTIRARILLLITALMIFVSMAFLLIATRDFKSELSVQNGKLVRETLNSAMGAIKTEYKNLISRYNDGVLSPPPGKKEILDRIEKQLRMINMNNIGCILVFDSSGKIVIHSSNLKNPDLYHPRVALKKQVMELFKKASWEPEKPIEYYCGDTPHGKKLNIACVNYYKQMDWYVAALVDKNELNKPVVNIVQRQFIILFLVSIFAVAVAVLISRKIAGPLALLARYSRDLPGKDFNDRDRKLLKHIKSATFNDEIRELACAFEYMESELEKNIRHLEDYQKNLETQVESRTKQLSDINKTLEHEIMERKEIEEKLKASEQRFRFIIEDVEGIAIQGYDRNQQVIFWNQASEKMYGYSQKEAMGKKITDIIIPEHMRREVEQNIKNCMESGGKIPAGELGLMDKHGNKVPVFSSHVMFESAYGREMYCIDIDLKAIQQAEEEKILAEKIAGEHEKFALVGQIAGKMAHDFNNILGAIMGNTELSLLDCKEVETRKTLKLILEQTLRGKDLTRNLVAFARDQELKQELFEINEKIDLVLSLLKKDLYAIEVIRENRSEPVELLADSGMIEHALINIVQNAIHALSKVEEKRIIIRTYTDADEICIEIEDNGCGIEEEYLEKIFEPAFTLKGLKDAAGSYKDDIRGTGYGMANVRKYINQHRGSIIVESTPGKGTKFIITLPCVNKSRIKKDHWPGRVISSQDKSI